MFKVISLFFFSLFFINLIFGLGVDIPTATTSTIIISNISSNSSDLWITTEGIKDNVVDILGSEITNDLGWITAAGSDTWLGNYTFYYTKSEVDNNFSLYYLKSNPNNFVNITSISNSTIVRNGNYNCSGTNVVQNITINSSGVFSQCVAVASSSDSWAGNYTNYYNKTQIDTNFSLYTLITNLVSYVGNWSLDKVNYYNKSQVDTNLSLFYLNSNPNNYINITSIGNSTIARTGNCPAGQVVMNTTNSGVQCVTPTAVETEPSWNGNYSIFTGLINNASYLSTYNSTYHNYVVLNSTNYSYYGNWVNDNSSWNQSLAYTLYLNRTSESIYLSTYNETYANNLDTNDSSVIASMNASWLSTYNSSYATWLGNYTIFTGLINNASYLSTFNTTYATTTTEWNGNKTALLGCINNASYLSTYNETYASNLDTNDSQVIANSNASWLSTFNTTYHNYVIANYSNVSNYWDNLSTYNSTQMDSTGGYLNILVSWLTSLFYTESEIDSKIINNQSYFSTYNETYATNLVNHTNITYYTYNSTWSSTYNVTYANYVNLNSTNFSYWWNNLFGLTNNWLFNNGSGYLSFNDTKLNSSIDARVGNGEPAWNGNYSIFTGLINNASYLSTFNLTYAGTTSAWDGNSSALLGCVNNASYLSTFNTTYDNYKTNVSINHTLNTYTNWNTIWSATGNSSYVLKSGDTMTGNLNFSNSNITNPASIIMKEISGACDLTINHSICSNSSGTFLIGIIIPLLGGLI